MELHEFEDLWIHQFRGVQTPDEVQMFPVLDILVKDQVGDLGQRDRTAQTTNGKSIQTSALNQNDISSIPFPSMYIPFTFLMYYINTTGTNAICIHNSL